MLEALVGPEQQRAIAPARERLERAAFVLAVVGEFSSGKSFLLNALLGKFDFEHAVGPESIAGLLATDINPSTATITELEYAAQDEAYAYYEGGRVERIPLGRLSRFVASEDDVPARVLLKIDSPFLHRGFTVADTPGLASINPAHRRATLQFLPGADAVLYLIDTQQPFSEGDASFLDIIRRQLDTIFIVQTKIDLWQHASENGKLEWESARDRIMQLAAIHAPGTYVYALSARDYIEGVLRNDDGLIERSRFPQFLTALDASLVRNTGRSRLRWARDLLEQAGRDEQERIRQDREMLALAPEELQRLRAQAQPRVAQAQAFVRLEKARIAQASERLGAAVRERGAALAQDAERALARAFDAADVARLRDRIRLHILVDGTLGEVVQTFASQVSDAVFEEYDRTLAGANGVLPMRFSAAHAAAEAFGASGNGSLWTQDPQRALCASIVLDAIGGPAIAIVHAVGARFSAAPPGSYMKRELTADLHATIWPAFRDEMYAFAGGIAQRIAGTADTYCVALDDALARVRDTVLGSIDRAATVREHSQNPREAADTLAGRAQEIQTLLDDVGERVQAFLTHGEEIAAADAGAEAIRRAHVGAQLDRESYRLGLRPQRWRVEILGALRRGKSSLINAFAGHRVLADEVAGAIAYPVHVRYGEQETAFALEPDGTWREVEIESALEEAARNPVLILTPWKLPRELVLVHAPAFDAGDATLEDVCMVAAREASEVLCLFSRQLSDRELALYERVAQLGKPMMFAHTLADNESASERRHVVDLAQQYLRRQGIPAQRLFTVSTLEYAQAKREGRAPAGWNELDALVSTIAAHAEEHMARLERLARAVAVPATSPNANRAPVQRGLLARLFSR